MRESLSILGRNRIFTVVFHLVVWTVIFFIPPVFIFWGTGEHALLYQLRMLNGPLTLALVFYVNYLVLCPRLLDNRMSMKKFLLLNLLLYIMGLGLMHLWRCIIDNCFMFFTGDSLPTQCKNIHCLTLWKKVLFNLRDCMLYFFISVLAAYKHQMAGSRTGSGESRAGQCQRPSAHPKTPGKSPFPAQHTQQHLRAHRHQH